MATVELKSLHHSYAAQKESDENAFSIDDLNLRWEDGSANALLGPSGCGKTTLLNVISGLLRPSSGEVLLDGSDVSSLPTRERHIAQVFQFPVVYDGMSVRENLAFPLRNRGHSGSEIANRVEEIAELLELRELLDRRSGHLNPAEKQIVSLGRGIVRKDAAAVLLDEPLTVIDPVLKLELRRKLRTVQQELKITMIYVTHDQHEALTFADRVTIMQHGSVVQCGTPEGLFLHPQTPFVGYFIGSPGMNMLECECADGSIRFKGYSRPVSTELIGRIGEFRDGIQVGIRPEFIEASAVPLENWLPCSLIAADHGGAYQILTLGLDEQRIKVRVDDKFSASGSGNVWVKIPADKINIYENGELRR